MFRWWGCDPPRGWVNPPRGPLGELPMALCGIVCQCPYINVSVGALQSTLGGGPAPWGVGSSAHDHDLSPAHICGCSYINVAVVGANLLGVASPLPPGVVGLSTHFPWLIICKRYIKFGGTCLAEEGRSRCYADSLPITMSCLCWGVCDNMNYHKVAEQRTRPSPKRKKGKVWRAQLPRRTFLQARKGRSLKNPSFFFRSKVALVSPTVSSILCTCFLM